MNGHTPRDDWPNPSDHPIPTVAQLQHQIRATTETDAHTTLARLLGGAT